MEQPMAEDDILGHAQLAKAITTPICLDESIESARDAAAAITLGACSIINVKPSRVGGYLEARRIHDVAAAHGVPVWCGGMLETGIGRAAAERAVRRARRSAMSRVTSADFLQEARLN